MATSLWKHQIGSLSSLRLLKGNDDLHNPCIITRALARKRRKPSRVYTAASSHWAERGWPPESQAQTPGPWASSPCFLLPPIVPAWLPTAPGQGPGSVWRSLSGELLQFPREGGLPHHVGPLGGSFTVSQEAKV